MKKYGVFFLASLFLIGLVISSGQTHAAEMSSDSYAISILKYKLNDSTHLSVDSPLDGTRVEKLTDENGNALTPLPGITYEITRVSPIQEQSDFVPVVGEDAFSVTVVTDRNGVARVVGLANGTYRVIEKESQLLKTVMEPVILELPLPQREGEALKEVYLYPKSSVSDDSKTSVNEEESVTPSSEGQRDKAVGVQKLPQTSGSIGTNQPLYFILAFLIVMGGIGLKVFKTKRHKY